MKMDVPVTPYWAGKIGYIFSSPCPISKAISLVSPGKTVVSAMVMGKAASFRTVIVPTNFQVTMAAWILGTKKPRW